MTILYILAQTMLKNRYLYTVKKWRKNNDDRTDTDNNNYYSKKCTL